MAACARTQASEITSPRLDDADFRATEKMDCNTCGHPRGKTGSSDYFLGEWPVTGWIFLRHHSDVPDLPGDTSICCNTTARRSGGRHCWEATCQGISWPPMHPRRVAPWSRGLFVSRHRPHWSHASVNPDAVRHFEIPKNSRMNLKSAELPN